MDYLSIAVRVFTEPAYKSKRKRRRFAGDRNPGSVLVIDCETTTDAPQRLTFGSYRYFRALWDGPAPLLTPAAEGIFRADDLALHDPGGSRILRRYVNTHAPDINQAVSDAQSELRLLSRTEFVDEVLYPAAFKARALVIGFNLPFDLSRLALRWVAARGRFEGGISLALWQYKPGRYNSFRPHIAVKTIDSKRALKGFTSPAALDAVDLIPGDSLDGRPEVAYRFRGHFLDLRTLAFALTDRSHTLESACSAFGVTHGKIRVTGHGRVTPAYIDYNRRDVQATSELFVKLMHEYGRHPIATGSSKESDEE